MLVKTAALLIGSSILFKPWSETSTYNAGIFQILIANTSDRHAKDYKVTPIVISSRPVLKSGLQAADE
jgi:hypothetical protein